MLERIGYYRFTVEADLRLSIVNITLQRGITVYGECECDGKLTFRVPMWQSKQLEAGLTAAGIAYQKGELSGAVGFLLTHLRRPSFVIGFVLAISLYLLLTSLVWEVRVLGSGGVDEDDVRSYLSEAGLYEGALRHQLDADAIAASYLLLDDKSAFVSIHLEGLIAYVELIPKDVGGEGTVERAPAHLVAERDAIVEEIQVYEGAATVKVGEVVKAGQLLVSGAITTKGGTRFVRAEADIWGRVEDTLTIEVPLEREVLVKGASRPVGWALTIFGRRFSWGEQSGEYVARERIYLFGLIRLPLVFSTVYTVEYENKMVKISEQEAASLALFEMRTAVLDLVSDGSLLKKEMSGGFTDTGYILTCTIVYQTNIAKSLAFSVDN